MRDLSDQTGRRLAVLSLAALGVVYGDIGTSPLYTMKEVFNGNHPIAASPENVLGILSMIFWSLILVVLIKYVIFIMRADNRGEGGIMALTALALRDVKAHSWQQKGIILCGIFGAAMFYGDGIVTPAMSVISAIEGLEVANPAFRPFVIPITLLVLLFLFCLQRRGTAHVGAVFGPIMLLWFSVLAILGVSNLWQHPQVLLAVNPSYAVYFLAHNLNLALIALGGVVLSVTGAEALYADMGHFGRRPISLVWFYFVLPCLLLNYFGQGALIIAQPDAIENPFFLSAPNWALYPLIALSTAAAVIASQAVISAAFSITRQAMQLGFVPRFEVRHTSDKTEGQIYMPGVNWILMLAVMGLVLGFKSSTNMAAAYGIAVTGNMVATSLLACIVAAKIWRWGWLRAVVLFSLFLLIELSFLSANIEKIPDGGWFSLVIGLLVLVLMTTWKRGRQLVAERLSSEGIELEPFIAALVVSMPIRVQGTAVFMNASSTGVPHALMHNLMHNKVLHERVVIASVQVLDVPYVVDLERVEMHKLEGGFYKMLVRYGFKDEPDIPRALELCAAQGIRFELMETSFFLGRETLIPKLGSDMALWREKLFIAMFRNASSATAFFKIPSNRVVELGTQLVL